MFSAVLMLLTINPDFYLPFYEFDRKYCSAELRALYALVPERYIGKQLYELRRSRLVQRDRMLKGLPPLPSRPLDNAAHPTPSQAAAPFSVVMMLLTVHPDFYLPKDKFDAEYCQPEHGRLSGMWEHYRNLGDSYDDARTPQERDDVAERIERVCQEIVRQTAELDEFRYYQRGRFLRGIPLHKYPKP